MKACVMSVNAYFMYDAYNISIIMKYIIFEEIALKIQTKEFLTFVFNLIIILTAISTELKTISKYFNGFESQRIDAKQWKFPWRKPSKMKN